MLRVKTSMRIAAGLSASILALAASAQAQQVQEINNDQRNLAEQFAEINAHVNDVTGSVSLTAAAIGNSFTAEVDGGTFIDTVQTTTTDTNAHLTVDTNEVQGSITATAAALGNSASITMDNAVNGGMLPTAVANDQNTNTADFYSRLNITGYDFNAGEIEEVGLNGTSAAIGNSLSVEGTGGMNTGELAVDTRQIFEGNAVAELDAEMEWIMGDVELAAVAIANSASITTEGVAEVNINNCQTTVAGECPTEPTLPEIPPPPPPPMPPRPRPVDPSAYSTVSIQNIEGDFTSTTAAISNSLSVSTLPAPADLNVTTMQHNTAYDEAIATIDVSGIAGTADITAVAIGNSVNISNLASDL